MLRAEIQRALRRAPRQLRRLARLANSPGFKSFLCPRWRIKFSLERFSDSVSHLLACPAVEKFSRASSAGGRRLLQIKFRKSDRVGRRGLSEPREDFSRLLTYVFPWLFPSLYPWIDKIRCIDQLNPPLLASNKCLIDTSPFCSSARLVQEKERKGRFLERFPDSFTWLAAMSFARLI